MILTICSATRVIIGTTTELPACIYFALSAILKGKSYCSGNPIKFKHSLGVNFLIPSLTKIRGTLWPPPPMFAVNVGHKLLLFPLQ